MSNFTHIFVSDPPAASYKTAKKGFRVKGIQTRSTLKLNTPSPVAPGGSLNYTIHSAYITQPLPGNASIRVSLEKGTWNKVIYETSHDYSLAGAFAYTGTYTPETVHPSGFYRLKLEVIAANGVKEQERYHGFAYNSSHFGVILEKVIAPSLVPGDAYELDRKSVV